MHPPICLLINGDLNVVLIEEFEREREYREETSRQGGQNDIKVDLQFFERITKLQRYIQNVVRQHFTSKASKT